MASASAENYWEFRVERQVPLKRHVAYRVMVNRLAEWWWHPSSRPVADVHINWAANGNFRLKADTGDVMQEGIILEVRPGWYFYMTDALQSRGCPGTPSMVGAWRLHSTPRDQAIYVSGDCATYTAVIRHFSEEAYLRNLSLGLERGWNEAADRFVKICEERPRQTKW